MNFEGYRDAEAFSETRIVPTAAMRDGVIQYSCADDSSGNTLCPVGNTVLGLSGASYTALSGNMAIAPATITAWDGTSLGPHGPDPAVLQYMSQYPLPNQPQLGDTLNTAGYGFHAPLTQQELYIAKLDYNITADARHRLSITAPWQRRFGGRAFSPRYAPETNVVNFNKGLIVGYSAVLSPTLVNSFRYGFVRESKGTLGDSNQPGTIFRLSARASRIPTPINGRSTTSRTIFPGTTASTPGSSAFSSRFCVIPKVT